MVTPELVKLELDRLTSLLTTRVNINKRVLNSKRKLIMDLIDTGFKKISDTKYGLDIKNYGTSYVSFIVTFRGKAVDIHEDHLILVNRNEVPTSEFGNSFVLSSVRYGKAMEAIYRRVIELSEEFSKENEYHEV
jgi:hypothetical protein